MLQFTLIAVNGHLSILVYNCDLLNSKYKRYIHIHLSTCTLLSAIKSTLGLNLIGPSKSVLPNPTTIKRRPYFRQIHTTNCQRKYYLDKCYGPNEVRGADQSYFCGFIIEDKEHEHCENTVKYGLLIIA